MSQDQSTYAPAGAAPATAVSEPKKRGGVAKPIGLTVLLVLALGGAWLWYSGRDIETTDDAYTDGRAVLIAPRVAGEAVSLDVADNQFVKQGEPLIHIDPRQYKIDRELAEGALASAKAQMAGQEYGFEVARKNFPPFSSNRRPSSPPPRPRSPRRRPTMTARRP